MKHVIQNLKVIFKVVLYLCSVVVDIILMKSSAVYVVVMLCVLLCLAAYPQTLILP